MLYLSCTQLDCVNAISKINDILLICIKLYRCCLSISIFWNKVLIYIYILNHYPYSKYIGIIDDDNWEHSIVKCNDGLGFVLLVYLTFHLSMWFHYHTCFINYFNTIIDVIYNTTHVDFNNVKISVEFRDNTAPLRSSIYSSTLGKCLRLNPNSLDTNGFKIPS